VRGRRNGERDDRRAAPLTFATLFSTLVLGHARGNALRAAVTLFAVALGVAISLAIDLANATAVSSFASSVNLVSNQVNLQVLGVDRGFDERALLRVRAIDGVRAASPAIEDAIVVGSRAGDPFSGEILRVLGVDLLQPPDFAAAVVPIDPYVLVGERGVIVSERVAREHRLRVGGPLDGLYGDRPIRLRVAGILPSAAGRVDSSVAFVDIVTAQELFAKVGRLDRIDCVVEPARLSATLRDVAAILPPGARAIAPATRTAEIRRMLRSFQLNLAALSYIALLVGMFLIYNTVAISVVQRRPEIGTLRAVGASKRSILWVFLSEGVLFGLLGSALGLALGAFLAQFSLAAVTRTVDELYVGTHADRVSYEPLLFAKAFLIGIVAAAVSAAVPALDAAAAPPAVATRAAGYERRQVRGGGLLALCGIALLACAVVAAQAPALGGVPVFGYVSGVAIIFGAALCMPLAIGAVARAARAATARFSAEGELGAVNLGAARWRNGVATSSLMVAIAMMVSVAILIGSFRATIVAWANDTLKADLFVRPVGLADASYDARFSPNLVARVRALPGVADVETFRAISLPFRGTVTTLGATDFATFGRRPRLRFLGHVDVAALARTAPGTLQVVVSEPFATRFGATVGDVIPLDTPSGRSTLRIAAVYNDYSSDAGFVLLDSRTFARLYRDDSVNSLAIYARPGVDLYALRTALLRSVLPRRVDVETNRELRALVVAIFNRTFAITYALYGISITIAVLGVVSTLFALVLERRREIGLLRYVGLSTAGVRRMVYFEAGYIGATGGAAGVGVGILLSLLLIFVINRQAFGWLIELHMPYAFLAQAFGMVIIAALLAGIYPARVAASIRTSDAVRTE